MNAGLKNPVTSLENNRPIQCSETEQLLSNVSSDESREKSEEKSHVRSRLWAVTYVCTVAIQCFFLLGFAAGSTSPVLSELSDEQDKYKSLRRKIDQDLFNITALVGATIVVPFGGYLVDYFGRKLSIILCSVPYTIGWLLIILTVATDNPAFKPLLYTGRFMLGLGIGWTTTSVGIYPAEMATRNIRGAFIVMNQLAFTGGTFLGQLIGVYISYYWLAMIPLAVTSVFTLLATTIKETPRWLMTRGRKSEARNVLRWLRGPNYDVDQELQDIESVLLQNNLTFIEALREFKNRSVYYPLILICIVFFFRQFSGIGIFLLYAEEIFKQAHVKSPGLTSSLATGGIQIISSVIGVFMPDLLGRRKLLIASSIAMCLSLGTMGAYEYLNNKPYCHPPDDTKCKNHLYPLAIVSTACFVASYSAGISVASWVLLPEFVPLRVRGLGAGIALFVNWGSTVIIAGCFDNYESVLKPWGTYWTFSLICLCSAIFSAVFIPETKGKSLEEIEYYFKRR